MGSHDALAKLNRVLERRETEQKPPDQRGVVLAFPYALRRDESALPNELVRSALFTANNRNVPRRIMNDVEIFSRANVRMVFNGEELRTNDEELFIFLVSCFEGKPSRSKITLTTHEIIHALGRAKSSCAYRQVEASMWRLTKAAFKLERPGVKSVMMHLIEWGDLEASPDGRIRHGVWTLCLSPRTVELFAGNRHTRINLKTRRKVATAVGMKLYEFYASHKNPYPVKLETLYQLCFNAEPSKQQLQRFKHRVKSCLIDLARLAIIGEWSIDRANLVHVDRSPQESLL